MSNQQLTSSFLDELFKLAFLKKSIIEILKKHVFYSFIPVEFPEYKFILKSIINQYDLSSKLPSYGVTSQQYQSNVEVQNALAKIKDARVQDQEIIVGQLFTFIRDLKFQKLFEDVYDIYNKDRKEEALDTFIKGAEELSKFSIKNDSSHFLKVFGDFKHNFKEKLSSIESGEHHTEKVPFGIDILDSLTDGGMDPGDTALWIMRSGVGKSTVLKWSGMYACRLGYDVLHIQLEGSKQEAFDKYSQIWTGEEYKNIKWGNISRDKMMKIDQIIDEMYNKQRDIEIYSFEKFGAASMIEIREIVFEYQKIHGKFPDKIIIDSLDLCLTGENKKLDYDPAWKKERLGRVAELMKDLAVEINSRIESATQTSNIPKQQWNSPDWVATREDTEGNKTLVKPFSLVMTGNITEDEAKKGIARIYIDKLRYYSPRDKVYPICTAYNYGKFYDRNRTLKEYSMIYGNK